MQNSQDRRAAQKAKLQNLLLAKQMANPIAGPNGRKSVVEQCEADVAAILPHIYAVSSIGLSDDDYPLWTNIVQWLADAVDSAERSTGTYAREARLRRFKLSSSTPQQEAHVADAKAILRRLTLMAGKLPPDATLQNPWRLGFQRMHSLVDREVARAGRDDDPNGNKSFIAACRQFADLGVPGGLPPEMQNELPTTAREWTDTLGCMESALREFQSSLEANKRNVIPAEFKRTMGTIRRLQGWMAWARTTYGNANVPMLR